MDLNKDFFQFFFKTHEHIRYGVTACLQDYEIFAFVSAFGIGWASRDKFKCELMTRSIFSNIDLVHSMVHKDHVVCVLGKNILYYQDLRRTMGKFVRQGHYNTKLELFVAFVKLERVKRKDRTQMRSLNVTIPCSHQLAWTCSKQWNQTIR